MKNKRKLFSCFFENQARIAHKYKNTVKITHKYDSDININYCVWMLVIIRHRIKYVIKYDETQL